MSEFFLKVVNMSISAGWLVLAVILLRLLFKKVPKWISVLLWGLVALRLLCPFSLESVLSLIPSAETISPEIMMEREPAIDTGIPLINDLVNPAIGASFAPDPATSANPLQLWIPTFAVLWIAGMAGMILYTGISYFRLRRRIGTAVLLQDHIYQSENVVSPFVLGLIRPRIYLPFHLDGKEMEYVVAHERAHIHRKDHLWKPLGFLLLTLHWFNPLMWLGYLLLCRDIELACDERVIREFDAEQKADYSRALLTCSVNRRMISACPLAFGEVGVKDRVKSVLHYKKPAFWMIAVAIVATAVAALCFLTDPKTKPDDELSVFLDMQVAEHNYSKGHTDGNFIVTSHKILGIDETVSKTTVYFWSMYHEYNYENGKIQLKAGSHIPTVITAKRTGSHGHYELVEYWTPGDGSDYAADIKEKFPWHLRGKALNSQWYVDEQKSFCENAAKEYFGVQKEDEGQKNNATEALEEPPAMIVISNEQSIEGSKGTSSWMCQREDGQGKAVMSDGLHPLMQKEFMSRLDLLPTALSHGDPLGAYLRFNAKGVTPVCSVPPDEIQIRCWEESQWGMTQAESEPVALNPVNGNLFFKLKDGNYVYEVIATWSSYEKFSGTVSYSFYTVKPDLDWKGAVR